MLKQFFRKDFDTVAGAQNVTAGRVVAAFYHGCNSPDDGILHVGNLLSFLFYQMRELFVIRVNSLDVILLFCIITNFQKITHSHAVYRNSVNCTDCGFVFV